MTLTGLRYFVALAQEKHFGRAAERCFVSQPTLSAGIKRLEEELGLALFERARAGVRLMPSAEPLVLQAQRVLEHAQDFGEMARQQRDPLAGSFRLGAIHTVGPYLFPALIPMALDAAPDMPVIIEEAFTAQLRDRLRRGELDAAIVALPFTEVDVVTLPIYEESFEVVMNQNDPLAHKDQIVKSDLNRDDLMLLGEGHCLRDQILSACPGLADRLNSQRSRVPSEGSSIETLRHMVAGGLGISVLPRSAIDGGRYAPGTLVNKGFADGDMKRTVALAWRASFPRPGAITMMVELLKKLAIELNAEPLQS
ncbi:MAG: LysR substrate-binding domain-containing protein [Litorivicinus sp.]